MILCSSRDAESLFFGFYGGEPLLEKELIQKCIQYIDDHVEAKNVYYNITTNATLLSGQIVKTFVDHSVSLLISLDGPPEIHNKNRGFEKGEGNPHEIILNNLRRIKDQYPAYYKEHVSFNTVLDGRNGFADINEYFNSDKLFDESTFLSTLISDNYAKESNVVSEKFIEESKYDLFLGLLTMVGRLKADGKSKLQMAQLGMLKMLRENKQFGDKEELPDCSHHGGNCIPGLHKLFLTVEGNLYPCEKISEFSHSCCIGTLSKGIDLDKVSNLLNMETITREECQKCWAYEYCTICLMCADDTRKISRDLVLKQCEEVRSNLEGMFKDYCVCREILDTRRYESWEREF